MLRQRLTSSPRDDQVNRAFTPASAMPMVATVSFMLATVPLALQLLRASRWFDRQVIDALEHKGWPRLTPAQTLVFPHLDPRGTSPAELARRLGIRRQSASDLIAGLTGHGLITVEAHPSNARRRLIHLTSQGRQLTVDAGTIFAQLENMLPAEPVAQLRAALDTLHLD